MGPGGASRDLVGWTRVQLWQHQVPATVLPAAGGVQVWLETGQQVVFPDGKAVGWFLAGWAAHEQAAGGAEAAIPTEETAVAPEPGAGEPTEGEE